MLSLRNAHASSHVLQRTHLLCQHGPASASATWWKPRRFALGFMQSGCTFPATHLQDKNSSHTNQNPECGKKTVQTGAESSRTKSCHFSEEGQRGHFLRCLSVCEGSCFQEVNTEGSLIPLGKGQLLESNPLNKNAAPTPAFLPGFLYDYEWKGFFLLSTGMGKLLPSVAA